MNWDPIGFVAKVYFSSWGNVTDKVFWSVYKLKTLKLSTYAENLKANPLFSSKTFFHWAIHILCHIEGGESNLTTMLGLLVLSWALKTSFPEYPGLKITPIITKIAVRLKLNQIITNKPKLRTKYYKKWADQLKKKWGWREVYYGRGCYNSHHDPKYLLFSRVWNCFEFWEKFLSVSMQIALS